MLKRLFTLVCCSLLLLPSLSLALEDPADFEIRFGVASVRLGSRDQAAIGQLASYLKAHPKVKITLSGHADTTGPSAFNVRLSHDRAAAVRDQLVQSFNIDKGRVGIAWLDASLPVASNATEAGRAANRRVVVQFVADGPTLAVTRSQPRQPAVRRVVTATPVRVNQAAERKPVTASASSSRGSRGALLKEVPLRYQQESGRLSAESVQGLTELASSLKANPGQTVLVQGVPHQGGTAGSDLQQARKRVEEVRARFIYGLKVPSGQVLVKWFGNASDNAAGDDAVGVLLKLMGGQ